MKFFDTLKKACKQEKKIKKKEGIESPYEMAKSQYEDRYGTEVKNSARLRRVCLSLIILCLVFGGCMAWQSTQNKVVPYIVQVDRHGYAVAIKSAEEGSVTSDKVVIATIGRIIMDFRTVVADPRAQERLIASVYACVAKNSPAEQTINEYYRENNPYTLVKEGSVGKIANINSITTFSSAKKAGSSWQVLWTEQTTQTGRVVEVATYRAIITIAISPVRELAQVISNPLGVYITEMHITKDMM